MRWLKGIPYFVLIGASILMALLPFQPEPHLLEKSRMLLQGVLSKPIDIFDLFWHSLPMFLLVAKYIFEQTSKKSIEK